MRNTTPCSAAEEALGKIGKPAVEPLMTALIKNAHSLHEGHEGDAQSKINEKMVFILVQEIGEPAIKRLAVALKDEGGQFRKIVVEALVGITDHQAIEPLVEPLIAIAVLKSENVQVRKAAIDVLSIDRRAVEPLTAILEDSHSDIEPRKSAIISLRWIAISEPRAVEPLIAVLKDSHSDIALRKSAISSLGETRYCRAIEALIDSLKVKGNLELRWTASEALKKNNRTCRPSVFRRMAIVVEAE